LWCRGALGVGTSSRDANLLKSGAHVAFPDENEGALRAEGVTAEQVDDGGDLWLMHWSTGKLGG
jgi:hypothetical protein